VLGIAGVDAVDVAIGSTHDHSLIPATNSGALLEGTRHAFSYVLWTTPFLHAICERGVMAYRVQHGGASTAHAIADGILIQLGAAYRPSAYGFHWIGGAFDNRYIVYSMNTE
jgi:hypothetical protein